MQLPTSTANPAILYLLAEISAPGGADPVPSPFVLHPSEPGCGRGLAPGWAPEVQQREARWNLAPLGNYQHGN